MTRIKWIRVKWAGLSSIRYFFLTLPDGKRIIVDHWYGLNFLFCIPFFKKTQKFNVYVIDKNEDISSWENLLKNQQEMISDGVKISSGILLARIFGSGVIASLFWGMLKLVDTPLTAVLEYLHIPYFLLILCFSFSFWIMINIFSKYNLQKKINLNNFKIEKKFIQLKFKDWLAFIAKNIVTWITIFLVLILGNTHSSETVIILTALLCLVFFVNDGIPRTADLYIKYTEEKNEK
ncbi:hypothetical protein FACS1894192_11900 [Bacilli bacterium]|nr:hypothetical protein FACS1894192_11900 [Bacilli bacterium]GHU45846.1 hypothetical protein FACS1894194_2460 [Bacilli bacterium]